MKIPVLVTKEGQDYPGNLFIEEDVQGGTIKVSFNDKKWVIRVNDQKIIKICVFGLKVQIELLYDAEGSDTPNSIPVWIGIKEEVTELPIPERVQS